MAYVNLIRACIKFDIGIVIYRNMETRTCNKCSKEYDLTKENFYVSKKLGFETDCKNCRKSYAKEQHLKTIRIRKIDETKCGICSSNNDLDHYYTSSWKFAGMTCKSCSTILLLANEKSDILLNAFLFIKNSEKP